MRRLVLPALLALAGCSDGPADRIFKGLTRDVIQSPGSVEAYRLDVPEHVPGKPYESDWMRWKMKEGSVVLDAATSKRLSDVLLDNATYYTGPPKACLFNPGVKVRFVKGVSVVTLLVCYDCRQMAVQGPGSSGFGDFDPSAPALIAIAKQLFPKDAEIQSLQ